jgi:phosphoribosylaminoimidazole carboxylase / phosphoribosylaminoimidazole-succinocarboxamide synthase
MAEIKRGKLIGKGKTKSLYRVIGSNSLTIIRNRNEITKNDDPDLTEILPGKGRWATATTTATFEILKAAGIPVAFEQRLNDTDFLAKRCEMIKLEIIARRYADGSYLKRNPHLRQPKGQPPFRFHRLMIEFFLKTSSGKICDKSDSFVHQLPDDWLEKDKKKPIDDPFISDPFENEWSLHHPKVPLWENRSRLCGLETDSILPKGVEITDIEKITRQTFLVLEGAWETLGYRLVDFKIEFGIDKSGRLLVADVIDNDSWRLRTQHWEELSKQLFRDNAEMGLVANKYELVADLVVRLRIPRQSIVVWRGSVNDKSPEIPSVTGIDDLNIAVSGHKSPAKTLEVLEKIQANYPDKGVIIAIVGMSNGLGPILAARTSWPVIAVPATQDTRPHDVWSSLEVPSSVPLITVLSPKNAVLAALNILAQTNPIAYMHRQYAIEELDE